MQQILPVLPRQPAILKVRPGPLPAVIKEPVVVVLHLQRGDFLVDELVQDFEVVL